MEEGGNEIKIILFRRCELVERCKFYDGNDGVFVQGIADNIESRMDEPIGLNLLECRFYLFECGAVRRLVFEPWDAGEKVVRRELHSVPYSAVVRQAILFLKCVPRVLFLLLLTSAFSFFLALVMSSIINQVKSPGKFPPKINHIIIVVHHKRRKSKSQYRHRGTKGIDCQLGFIDQREGSHLPFVF